MKEAAGLTHDDTFSEARPSAADWSDQHANGLQLETVRLVNVDLSASRVEKLKVTDGELTKCSLANLQGRAAEVTRVTIDGTRATGMAAPESSWRDVTFRGCRLDMASFGFAHLTRVTFEDCLMAEASFLDARLECVRFHRCELTRGDFRGASLERCEFRGGDLTDLEGVTHLRGAAIDWAGIIANANLWAAALGIEILDAE